VIPQFQAHLEAIIKLLKAESPEQEDDLIDRAEGGKGFCPPIASQRNSAGYEAHLSRTRTMRFPSFIIL
jgi:hypothetical protein